MHKYVVVLGVIGCVWSCIGADASSTDVPRILLVGDSGGSMLQAFRSFEYDLAVDYGITDVGQRGNNTTYVGVLASEFDSDVWRGVVQDELEAYPTIDIVILSLGANDFVSSGFSAATPPEQVSALIDAINGRISNVIDTILAVRKNIRIALCGYDFVRYQIEGTTASQLNAVWAQSEHRKLEMTQTKERTYYVHNLGLMQYYYGIPDDASPAIPPYTLSLPGGYPDYTPFPGGDPDYYSPSEALLDGIMHLSIRGYDLTAGRCLSEFCSGWLSWPAVYEILPLGEVASGKSQFRVTFSKAVTGVDAGDFTAGGTATVDAVVGEASVYTVTVNLNGEPLPGVLALVDDDSIMDSTSNPLGGPGAENGSYSANGALVYTDPVPDGTDDFDVALSGISSLCKPFKWIISSIDTTPTGCDINGEGFTTSPLGILGNGIRDTCELGVLRACLRTATLDLSATGGITHQVAQEAWEHNFAQMTSDLGGSSGRIEMAIPGITTLLAGFMTLGDRNSVKLPAQLISALSMFTTLEGVSAPAVGDYIRLSQYLGPDGDADGDGVSNVVEYNYTYPVGGASLYEASALDATEKPDVNCTNYTGGSFMPGVSFCVAVPGAVNPYGGFEWQKDGVALLDDDVISGVDGRELHFNGLRPSDSGSYKCVYDSGSQIFGPVQIEIAKVPALGTWGLWVLILTAACVGVSRLTRGTSCD